MISEKTTEDTRNFNFKVVDYKTMKERVQKARKTKKLLWPKYASYQSMYAGIVALEIEIGVYWPAFPTDNKNSGYKFIHDKYEYVGQPQWRRYCSIPAGALHAIVCNIANDVTGMPIWFENDRVDIDYLLLVLWMLKPDDYYISKRMQVPVRETISVGQDQFVVLAKKKISQLSGNLMRRLTNLLACKSSAVATTQKIEILKTQINRIADSLLNSEIFPDPELKKVIESWKLSAEQLSSRDGILTSSEWFQNMYYKDPKNYPFSNGNIILTPRPLDPPATSAALVKPISETLEGIIRPRRFGGNRLNSEVPKTPGMLDEPEEKDLDSDSARSDDLGEPQSKIPHKLKELIRKYREVQRLRVQLELDIIYEMVESYWTFDSRSKSLIPVDSSFQIPTIPANYIQAYIDQRKGIVSQLRVDKGKLKELISSVGHQKKQSNVSLLDNELDGHDDFYQELRAAQNLDQATFVLRGEEESVKAILAQFESNLMINVSLLGVKAFYTEVINLINDTQLLLPPEKQLWTCIGAVVKKEATKLLLEPQYQRLSTSAANAVTVIQVSTIRQHRESRTTCKSIVNLVVRMAASMILLFLTHYYSSSLESAPPRAQILVKTVKGINSLMRLYIENGNEVFSGKVASAYEVLSSSQLTIFGTVSQMGTEKRVSYSGGTDDAKATAFQAKIVSFFSSISGFIQYNAADQQKSYLGSPDLIWSVAHLAAPFAVYMFVPDLSDLLATTVLSPISLYCVYDIILSITVCSRFLLSDATFKKVQASIGCLNADVVDVLKSIYHLLKIVEEMMGFKYKGIPTCFDIVKQELLLEWTKQCKNEDFPIPKFVSCYRHLSAAVTKIVDPTTKLIISTPEDFTKTDEIAKIYKDICQTVPAPQAQLIRLLGCEDYFSLDSKMITTKSSSLYLGSKKLKGVLKNLTTKVFCEDASTFYPKTKFNLELIKLKLDAVSELS